VLKPCPTKELALAHNIPVLTPEKLDSDTISAIREYGCDYALVVAYGKIFPEELIASFQRGVLNVHYSLLPKYRGATPLETALLNGESTTGVTIQKMVKAMDAGDIIAQEETAIGANETARELRPRLINIGAQLLVATLPSFERGETIPKAQDASKATRAYKIKKEDGLLDLSAPAEENWCKYRAYADSIGTYFFDNEKRVKITSAEFAGGKFLVLRVIPEGKREISFANFRSAASS
jgi:methionyl-tRNA formyltransferase